MPRHIGYVLIVCPAFPLGWLLRKTMTGGQVGRGERLKDNRLVPIEKLTAYRERKYNKDGYWTDIGVVETTAPLSYYVTYDEECTSM
jgi:hypothetical protein